MSIYADQVLGDYIRISLLNQLGSQLDNPSRMLEFLSDPEKYVRQYAAMLIDNLHKDLQDDVAFINEDEDDDLSSVELVDHDLDNLDIKHIATDVKNRLNVLINEHRRGKSFSVSPLPKLKAVPVIKKGGKLISLFSDFKSVLTPKVEPVTKPKHSAMVRSLYSDYINSQNRT